MVPLSATSFPGKTQLVPIPIFLRFPDLAFRFTKVLIILNRFDISGGFRSATFAFTRDNPVTVIFYRFSIRPTLLRWGFEQMLL